ncbi:MAG: SDR family NAD(P)-dependent oxidoreductase [Bacteroidales bacterium]|nr:SDR family NAD(P)-dependent oxidoreductase [Bacteroidales bacterium]
MKKYILITGSTDGIGKLLAIKLAIEGHQVYIHGRNQDKVTKAMDEIKAKSRNETIGAFVGDLSDMNAVRQLAQDIKAKVSQIDILVNNAGVFMSGSQQSANGCDMRFVVNYLAPYLLTHELLPLMNQSRDARIINLSSAAQSELSYEAIMGRQHTSVNALYAQSKLALTMWSFYLAQQKKDMIVIAVNPGSLLNTKMANEAYGQYWSPAEKGADILYDLTIAEKHKKHSGEYFDNDSGRYARAHSDAYNNDAIRKLIDFTNNLISI